MEGFHLAYRSIIRDQGVYFCAELWLRGRDGAGTGAGDGNDGGTGQNSPGDAGVPPPPEPPRGPPPGPPPPGPPGPENRRRVSRRIEGRTSPSCGDRG